MSLSIAFIINGKVRFPGKLRKEIAIVFEGYEVSVQETSRAGDAMEMTRSAILKGSSYVIAVGGDGTINEVVNGIMNGNSAPTTIMGILPRGTGNDFVRTFRVNKDLAALRSAIQSEQTARVDIGRLTFNGLNGILQSRYFINIADVGIGGVVTQQVSSSNKSLNPKFTYLFAIVRSFFLFSPQGIKFSGDNFKFDGEVLSLCMANGRYFASGLCIAPNADLYDGKAEIVILGKISLWEFFINLGKVRKGEMIKHPKVYYHQTATCHIESDDPCPIDVDGDFVGYTPLEMEMLPAAISIVKA
jgi:diacylglycerol kinase (ATP)